MITVGVGELVTHGRLKTVVDVVALVEGRLTLSHDGRIFFDEASFPLPELLIGMKRWLAAGGLESSTDFEFESMSAEEPGILWFRAVRAGWRVGSVWQYEPCLEVISGKKLLALTEEIVGKVRSELRRVHGGAATELLDVAVEQAGLGANPDR